MAWTKAKTAIVAGAAVILAAGTVTPIVIHHYRANSSIFSSKTELTDADNANYQKLTGTTPAQVAQTFFDVCAKEDWLKPPSIGRRIAQATARFYERFHELFRRPGNRQFGQAVQRSIILAGIPAGNANEWGTRSKKRL